MAPPATGRRSSRSSRKKEIVAPGFGTESDVQRLTSELGGNLPVTAVTAMMRSEGRGIRSRSRGGADDATSTNPLTSPQTSNAWADFMQEEGMGGVAGGTASSGTALNFDSTPTATATTTAASSNSSSTEPDSKRRKVEDTATTADYDLTSLEAASKSKEFGSLVQSGTLDSRYVGRKAMKAGEDEVYHLHVPAVLLPKVAITRVCTSCNAAHAIAIDKSHQAYGWGRNENLVLGNGHGMDSDNDGPPAVTVPTPRIIATEITMAALGKMHTIFLKTDGTLYAVGSNKSGQCAWRENIKQSGALKACQVSSVVAAKGAPAAASNSIAFAKVACGEDFSVALDTSGILYTAGSSEYGQLGTGETGEYFVTANKLAYTNGYSFAPQHTFHHTDNSSDTNSRRNDQTKKTAVLPGCATIRFQDIACGKHHALALEAPSQNRSTPTRIFSWGCGDYGCLGHGRQQDEYFPRHVEHFMKGLQGTKLAAGGHASLVLTTQGHVYFWGQTKQNSDAVMKPQLVDALANNQHNVTHIGAGAANVACSTDLGNTVVWGMGPYGELGLGTKKSSAKPAFVDSLSGVKVLDLACGQGTFLYVTKDDKNLPVVDLEGVEKALA